MDRITTAIMAALPTLASETIKDSVKSAVKSAYEGLKAVIRGKWGDAAPISKAITAVEEDPNSKAQAAVLAEKVAAVKADEDADVLQALRALVEQMKTHSVGGEAVAKIQFYMSGGVVQIEPGLIFFVHGQLDLARNEDSAAINDFRHAISKLDEASASSPLSFRVRLVLGKLSRCWATPSVVRAAQTTPMNPTFKQYTRWTP
jgi:hypothetical protein